MTPARKKYPSQYPCTCFLLALALMAAIPPRAGSAQTISNVPRAEMWVTDGHVNAVLESCGTLYLGGTFTYIGPRTGPSVALDSASAHANPSSPRLTGQAVWTVVADGTGGWYLGGNFTAVGCVARTNLAHILSDGTLDLTWNPPIPNNTVSALVVSGNTVYVGGSFSSIGGQTRNSIGALDATTGALTAWNPNANIGVFALAVSNNIVYAGGGFTTIGGQSRNRIAALDATTGAATSWDPNASSNVHALVVYGNTIFAGGDFATIGGQSRNRIAALDASTGAATVWNPNATGTGATVRAFAASGSTIYAGGNFTSIGGQSRTNVAALDTTTGAATLWNPAPNEAVLAIHKLNNTVYIGGGFILVGGQPRNRLAAIDATTGAVTTWNPGANSTVYAMAGSGNTVFAGGEFNSCSGLSRNYFAALDTVNGTPTAWNPTTSLGSVYSFAVLGNVVYVGGEHAIVAIDRSTGVPIWTKTLGGFNRHVDAVAVSGSTVYVGGDFTQIDGQTRNYLAALDAATGAITAWSPNPTSTGLVSIFELVISGDTLYVAGNFETMDGQSRNSIAAFDTTTGSLTAWNPNASNEVYALAVSGTTVYAGGVFATIGGQTRLRIAALDAITGAATSWNPSANNLPIRALAVSGNTVFVGGNFTSIGGQPRNNLAALDSTSGMATTWNPNAGSAVYALNVSNANVFAGGVFASIGNQPLRGFAGFKIINAGWVDAADLWSVASNWSPPVVPNNTSCDQYNVRIAGAASQVTLDIDATINALAMEDNASLLITGGDLTIASPEGITNAANIFVGPGQALIASTATNVCGVHPIELAGADAALSSTAAENTIRLSAPVVGFGVIDAAFQNESTIDANASGETLDITGSLSATSGGEMRASNGGTLRFTRSLGGASAFIADSDGIIDIPGSTAVTVFGSTANVSDGGTLRTSSQASLNLTSHLEIGGCLGFLRGCTPPVLNAIGSSTTTVGGNFSVAGTVADVTVEPTTTFELAGDFDNQCTSPAAFHWESGPLTINGAGPQTFEAAGQDLGPINPAGFIDNFAMGTLRIEPARTVDLVNAFDNDGSPGCEALYVDTLSLGSGATFKLNGCNVYYNSLVLESRAAIIRLNGSLAMSTDSGDLDGDDDVDFDDMNQFLDVLLGGSCSPLCLALADINGDGAIDGLDIALMTRLLTGW
jgi:putative pyrroloquinoline-quinone binding quinoprotein/dockerin type I repeat protein